MPDQKHDVHLEVAEDVIKLSNNLVTLFFDTQLGLLMLTTAQEKTMCFSRAYIRVQTDSETFDTRQMVYKGVSAVDFTDQRGSGKAAVLRLVSPDSRAEVHLKLSIASDLPGYSCVVQFKNKSGQEVRMQSFDTFALEVDDSTRLFTGWKGTDLRFFRNGSHSWELSQASAVKPGDSVSHLFTVLHNYKSSQGIVIGFVTSRDQFSQVMIQGRDSEEERLARVVATSFADGVPLADRQTMMSEEMVLLVPQDMRQGLQTYVDITSERMNAVLWPSVPSGWCSWYFYYTQPDETEMLLNVEFLSKRFPGTEFVQLDDGYQKTVGDWAPNERFSSGLEKLVSRIDGAGFKAGVWTAPFVATEHSDLYKDRPGLFVRDRNNLPVVVGQNPLWLGSYYALDLTNPAVLRSIETLFEGLKKDGFCYFKIDFLFHAAVEGIRHDPHLTRAQAIRSGLDTVRRAVGQDFILGCGAPLGPSIGIVNGMRIGTDIAAAWRYEWGGGVYECSVNTMTRAIMHNRWWVNDPDCVLVRQQDTALTLDEVRLWLSVVAVSGGAVLMSDRMVELSEERLQLLDKILPVYGKSGVSIDSLVEPEPRVFALPIETGMGRWAVVAVVNLSEVPIDVQVPISELDLGQSTCHIQEFWSQEYEGRVTGRLEVKGLEPHSSRLYVVRPESRLPCVLGTSIHFTQGAVELSDQDWDPATKELSVVVQKDTREEESITFVFNDDWEPVESHLDGETCIFEQKHPNIATIKSRFSKGQEVRIRFTRE